MVAQQRHDTTSPARDDGATWPKRWSPPTTMAPHPHHRAPPGNGTTPWSGGCGCGRAATGVCYKNKGGEGGSATGETHRRSSAVCGCAHPWACVFAGAGVYTPCVDGVGCWLARGMLVCSGMDVSFCVGHVLLACLAVALLACMCGARVCVLQCYLPIWLCPCDTQIWNTTGAPSTVS